MIPWTVNDILEERNKQMNKWRSEISQISQLKFLVNLLIAVINMKINRRENNRNSWISLFYFLALCIYYTFLQNIFLNVPHRARGRSCAWYARQQPAKALSCTGCSDEAVHGTLGNRWLKLSLALVAVTKLCTVR